MEYMNKQPLIVSDIRIKAYEVDAMGIVSNIVYIKWFEDLRHLMLDRFYPYQDMMKEGKSPILIKTEVEYKKPLTIMDEPVGRLWFSLKGRSRWEIHFEICVDNIVYCTGKQSGYYYDMLRRKPTAFPEWFINKFKEENSII